MMKKIKKGNFLIIIYYTTFILTPTHMHIVGKVIEGTFLICPPWTPCPPWFNKNQFESGKFEKIAIFGPNKAIS
jgi:hypothetical protein